MRKMKSKLLPLTAMLTLLAVAPAYAEEGMNNQDANDVNGKMCALAKAKAADKSVNSYTGNSSSVDSGSAASSSKSGSATDAL